MLYADRPLPDQCWPLHTLWMANLLMFQKVPENFTLVNTVTLIGFGSFQSSWSSCWKYTWQKTFRPGWVRLQYTVWSANHYIYVYSMSGLQFCSSDWDDWLLRLSLTFWSKDHVILLLKQESLCGLREKKRENSWRLYSFSKWLFVQEKPVIGCVNRVMTAGSSCISQYLICHVRTSDV